MDLICPLCNGIKNISLICKECGKEMNDEGALVNFLDSYSPYLSNDITVLVDGAPANKCMHLFQCTLCNNDEKYEVERIMK